MAANAEIAAWRASGSSARVSASTRWPRRRLKGGTVARVAEGTSNVFGWFSQWRNEGDDDGMPREFGLNGHGITAALAHEAGSIKVTRGGKKPGTGSLEISVASWEAGKAWEAGRSGRCARPVLAKAGLAAGYGIRISIGAARDLRKCDIMQILPVRATIGDL